MRILVLSDIHANLAAFEAVVKDAGTVDAVWCLGDVVGYGPDPNECIELLRSLPNLVCLMGNHDAAALNLLPLETFNREARLSIDWLQHVLKPEHREFLSSLPDRAEADELVTLVHGSPRNPVWEYLLDNNSAWENFGYFKTQLCFVGHTHLPVAYFKNGQDEIVDRKLLVAGEDMQLSGPAILNPGSTGQPRDHDPRAAYAIFVPETKTWEPHRVEYDILAVQQRIYAARLPFRHALRLAEGW